MNNFWTGVAIAAALLFVAIAAYGAITTNHNCKERGGIPVRVLGGYECFAPECLLPPAPPARKEPAL